MRRRRRILLGQLASNGDCVYATTLAWQIKANDPDCHLTWAIGSGFRQVIAHNPHVDEVWEVELVRRDDVSATWRRFAREAQARKTRGEFDEIYLTQIFPDNFQNFDGTVRSSIFRGYGGPITVPVTPVIRLSPDEVDGVRRFALQHGLEEGGPAVLFESAPQSGQSKVTKEWSLDVARRVVTGHPSARMLMTSPIVQGSPDPRIVDASRLGFRDIAALSRYCSLLVGCSSGLTWLLTSDAAQPLPTIQVLARSSGQYGAVVHDLEHWGLSSAHVIELHDSTPDIGAACALEVLTNGVRAARQKYHETLPLDFKHYAQTMLPELRHGNLRTFYRSLKCTIERYGFAAELGRDLGGEAWSMLVR